MTRSRWIRTFVLLAALLLAAAALVAWLNVRGESPVTDDRPSADAATVARGAYIARLGNCAACHTDRGGASYAGGKGIATPFGTVYATNLTPDDETGLGRWSASAFWRAMHNGRSRDGRLLYPAFPYTDYTLITREDSDALYAYLRSVPAVKQQNRPHDLRFPYNTQASLAVWRALFFSPEPFRPEPAKSAEWNRGSYLVRGLGHCQACHAPRNAFGATTSDLEFSGGLIPMQNWYAPSLASMAEAGVQDWSAADIAQLLRSGTSPRGTALGPMAEVVFRSTQYMNDADVQAMAAFLKDIPRHEPPKPEPVRASAEAMDLGQRVYARQCAECHGEKGEGGGAAYPPLAGNRTVTMNSSANLVRVILSGGFPPTTPGNPRPYGMPPFGQSLSEAEIAAVASYVRGSWGNAAPAVTALDVHRVR
jgi:mono/diheme cytochrome c family protein